MRQVAFFVKTLLQPRVIVSRAFFFFFDYTINQYPNNGEVEVREHVFFPPQQAILYTIFSFFFFFMFYEIIFALMKILNVYLIGKNYLITH